MNAEDNGGDSLWHMLSKEIRISPLYLTANISPKDLPALILVYLMKMTEYKNLEEY